MGKFRALAHFASISSICILVSTYALYNHTVSLPGWTHSSGPYPSDTRDNLIWFVQVSDVHISRFLDPERGPEFQDFCTNTLKTINPSLVLVTGDLTDAKHIDRVGSEQFEDEWIAYAKILHESGVTKKYPWLDIRGNHDAFDVLKSDDPTSNYYIKYSGDRGRRTSSVYHLDETFGKYSFIPVDATLIPGPRRPYNFFGYLPEERVKTITKFVEESRSSNFTIWYSHYPTSCIDSGSPGIRSLVAETGGVYLAGHLHTLGGLGTSMYAMNSKGFLELELGDWMKSRIFRIMAVDHDLFSFSDVKYNEWPAIVITNPKAAKLMMPSTEPLGRIRRSSHIRFLVFSPNEITSVKLEIDGLGLNEKPQRVPNSPLWVVRWDPSLYDKDMHSVSITAVDSAGNTNTVTQSFSLGTSWKLDFQPLPALVLVADLCSLLCSCFYAITLAYLAAILFARCYPIQAEETMLGKLGLLMKEDVLFRGFLIFGINLLFGPWFIGELITGNIGICFSFGLLLQGKLQPERTLYAYGIVTMILFYIPCPLFLAYWNYEKKVKRKTSLLPKKVFCKAALLLFSSVVYVLLHIKWCWAVFQAYGTLSAILCPSRLWWFVFVCHQAWKIWAIKIKADR